jgi:hypothetical protein
MGKAAHHGATGGPMNMSRLGFGIVSVVAVVSAAMPLATQRYGQTKLQKAQEFLEQQAGEMARLTSEKERLSRLAAGANPEQTLSAEQVAELLKLRNEIGRLRSETNEAHKLREENRRLQAASTAMPYPQSQLPPAELEAELSAQTINAMKSVCLELPLVLQKFANDHSNQATSLSELRDYFPTTGGHKMPGLYTFDFVRDEGRKPGDALILCEQGSRQKLEGTWARVYGFRDGSAVEVISEDDNFDAWEKQHLSSPPP